MVVGSDRNRQQCFMRMRSHSGLQAAAVTTATCSVNFARAIQLRSPESRARGKALAVSPRGARHRADIARSLSIMEVR